MSPPRFQPRHSRTRRTPARVAALLAFGFLLSGPTPAIAGHAVFESSLEHADYGDAGETTSLTVALAWRAPRWSLSLSSATIDQEAAGPIHVGPGVVPRGDRGPGVPGGADGGSGGGGQGGGHGGGHGGGGGGSGGGGGVPGGEAATGDASGLRDPVLRLDVALPAVLPAGAGWGLFGAVKAPLADEDLGTEEWDAGAGLTVWRTGLLTDVYAELGTWLLGEPEGVELDDPLVWRASVTRRTPGGRWAFAALTRGGSEVVEGLGSTAEVGAWVGRSLGGTRTLGLSATAGLGDAAPDWSVALSWRAGVPGLRPDSGP